MMKNDDDVDNDNNNNNVIFGKESTVLLLEVNSIDESSFTHLITNDCSFIYLFIFLKSNVTYTNYFTTFLQTVDVILIIFK